MKIFKYSFSLKFYLGIIFIVTSLIIGKVTLVTFVLYLNNPVERWLSLAIYILSWPLLIVGIWWIGKEYAAAVKKYVSYQFYHDSLKKGTQKAINKTRQFKNASYTTLREGTQRTLQKTKEIKKTVKHKFHHHRK